MTKSNVNATKLAVIAVAIAVIGTSTMFILRSIASLRSDPRPTASTPLDMREAVPRDIIANDTGLADRVRERFSSQEDVDALSPHQFELLAEQFGTVLGAHAGGTLDDYVSLMESWGGTLMLSEKDIADIRPGWKEPDHPLTIKRYAIDSLTLSVQQAPTQPRIRATAPGQFGLTFISQFHFKVRQWELLGKTQEAQVMLSAETNGGDQLDLQYSFLWSPQDDRWIPYQMTTTSRTGKPVASRIY